MKFFIDTANLDEIREANELGLIDGVTTNPSLVAKEGNVDFKEHICRRSATWSKGDISAEVTALDTEGMLERGPRICKDRAECRGQVPADARRAESHADPYGRRHRVNVTLCFSAAQALLAAKAGAKYISPFIGRLDDIATDGMQLIRDIVQIYDNYGFATEVSQLDPSSDAHRRLRPRRSRCRDDPL